MNKKNKSSVPDGNDQLTSLWTSVKQDRDELRVQIHLAKTEVKDEWLLMEDKWHKVQQRIHLSSSRQAKVNHRSEEHTSELQSPVPISYAVFCLKKKKKQKKNKQKKTKNPHTRHDRT